MQSPAAAQAASDAAQTAAQAAQVAAQAAHDAVAHATGAQAPVANSLSAMQAQYLDLTIQLAGLKAQWNGLQNQLESMRLDNPARPAIQQQAANVGVQIAGVEGQLATLKAQIAQRHGHVTVIPPDAILRNQPWIDVGRASGPLAIILAIAVLGPLSFGIARRLSRPRHIAPVDRTDTLAAARMERLEQAVDSIAIEVERISENQRFMTRVLVEKNPSGEMPAPNDRVT